MAFPSIIQTLNQTHIPLEDKEDKCILNPSEDGKLNLKLATEFKSKSSHVVLWGNWFGMLTYLLQDPSYFEGWSKTGSPLMRALPQGASSFLPCAVTVYDSQNLLNTYFCRGPFADKHWKNIASILAHDILTLEDIWTVFNKLWSDQCKVVICLL